MQTRGVVPASALVCLEGDLGKLPRAIKMLRYQRSQHNQVLSDSWASTYPTGTAVSLRPKTSRTNEGLVRRTQSTFLG